MGPSGAGKDTLIDGARTKLNGNPRYSFPRRIVTRRAGPGEDHDEIDAKGFADLRTKGGLALAWSAHGLSYGLPASIETDLAAGRHVIANVSRGVTVQAQHRFSPLGFILVTAPLTVLLQRIEGRGRETLHEIAERMRTAGTPESIAGRAITVVNDGTIEAGVEAFLGAIDRIVRRS
jgi:phosphonate metabolism protein PhnN/1,5-bisphosphokinase (PRPP-forming)